MLTARKTRAWGRWAWGLAIAALLGVGGYEFAARGRGAGRDPAAPGGPREGRAQPVAVVAARRGDVPIDLRGLGSVTAFNTVSVRSRVDGTLVEIHFQEGQSVRKGDLLAQIDPRPFQVQLEQAEGQLARDQALLANARLDLTRYETLSAGDLVPRQQLDTQAGAVGQLEGTVKSDQAQIDNARLQLTYCRITAPIGGRIGLRQVDVGNVIHAADAGGLAVITQVRPIAVLFSLPEDRLPTVLGKLKEGRPLPVEAYDRSGQTLLATGRLLTVDNQIDPTTGTTRLKAVFDNDDDALFPNQFVNARLLLDVLRGAVIVPQAAVQRGPKGSFVYVVAAGGTAAVRPVTLGPATGTDVAIASGIAAGDAVVVDGTDKLRDGSRVRVETQAGGAQPGP